MTINPEVFHHNLLGKQRELTPEEYWPTDRHRAFYTAFEESDVRGFASADSDPEQLLGVLVLALILSQEGPVFLLTPRHKTKWVTARIKEVARHVFRLRRGDTESAGVLWRCFRQLKLMSPTPELEEPERWFAFGLDGETVTLPEWAEGKLLHG